MAATILLLDGKPAVEIPDADGEVFTYVVSRLPDDFLRRRWTVERREPDGTTDQDHTHLVECHSGERWLCSCKAWQFSRDRWVTGCKHTRHVRELVAILEAMR